MRVAVVANHTATITSFRLELLRGLAVAGHDVQVIVPTGSETEMAAVRATGARVVEWPLDWRGTSLLAEARSIAALRRLLSQARPDHVLSFTLKPNLYVGLMRPWLRFGHIATITGLGTAVQTGSRLRASVVVGVQKLVLRGADRVFFQNASNRGRLVSWPGIRRSRTRLTPGSGVNLEEFGLAPYPPPDQPARLVVVSRLQTDKGYTELIAAVREVAQDHPELHLDVIGWPVDADLVRLVGELEAQGVVTYHGGLARAALQEVVRGAQALVHPSHHEGMANVILEAAALGRPVLASAIPGCQEAVVDGVSGTLFEVKSAPAIARALSTFLTTSHADRERMGLAGRQHVATHFDRELVTGAYVAAVREIGASLAVTTS